MSAATRKVTTDKGEFEYDPDMPIGALKGLLGGATDNDLDSIIRNLAKFVIAWPFEGDPADPEAWDNLKRTEFNAVVTGVMADLGKLGEE